MRNDEKVLNVTATDDRCARVLNLWVGWSCVAGVVGSALFSAAVSAQEYTAAPGQLQTIVVTAQKRQQPLQDVPFSVAAISGTAMDQEGANDFEDILLSIPGVSYSDTSVGGQSQYSIRGVSTAAASPTVGVYLDDISLVTLTTIFTGAEDPVLFDLARVEVLKGPQGTLYGGSAMGGAIKYVTQQPDLDRMSVAAEGGVSTTDHGGTSYKLDSVLNLPLIGGKLGLRIGGYYRYDAGYVDNVPDGTVQNWGRSAALPGQPFEPETYSSQSTFFQSNANDDSTTVARVELKYAVDDSLTILPMVTIQRSDQANPGWFFTNMPYLESSFRFAQPTRDDLSVYALTIDKSFSGMTFTSLSSYVDRSVETDRDYSFFVGGLLAPLYPDNSYNTSNTSANTASQEFRLASDQSRRVKWTLGAFYSQQRNNLYQGVDTVGAGALFNTGTDLVYVGNNLTRTWQEAAFGDVTYSLTDRWDVSGGLRWFDIRQRLYGVANGVLNGGLTEVNGLRSVDVGVTPKISVSYHVDDDRLLYARASKGFRQGGPNQYDVQSSLCAPDFQRLGISGVPSTFKSDSLWTYELGSKNLFKDVHTIVNGAIFYTDWKKIQQQVTLPSCGFSYTGNVGAATIRGAELSVESAVSGRLSVGATGTYLDTRITQSSLGVSAQVGQPVLDTPKWMVSVYGDYAFLQTDAWTGSFRAEYAYHGWNLRSFPSVAPINYLDGVAGTIPDATQVQQAYHVVNGILSFAHDSWDYRLYVDNLTNAEPYIAFRRSSGLSEATTIRPRTFGISVKTTF